MNSETGHAATFTINAASKYDSETKAKTHIEIRSVGKTYVSTRESLIALKNIELGVSEGQFVSVLGPSGCGKSTLLKCIAGLEKPSVGQISVNGEVVTKPPANLGVVFQRDLLLDWRTALDNVLVTAEFLGLPRRDFVERARSLLRTYGLEGYENCYPWEMSGGMRQRVAICRAMLSNPSLLLMDEPFGALDALTRDELNLELQNRWLADRKTVVFVTHGISEAVFLSDRVVLMRKNPGSIVEDVTIDLPRPRSMDIRDSPEFAAYTSAIRQIMNKSNSTAGR